MCRRKFMCVSLRGEKKQRQICAGLKYMIRAFMCEIPSRIKKAYSSAFSPVFLTSTRPSDIKDSVIFSPVESEIKTANKLFYSSLVASAYHKACFLTSGHIANPTSGCRADPISGHMINPTLVHMTNNTGA